VQGAVLAEFSADIITEAGALFQGRVNSVAAADFNPLNGLLYFTATGGEGNIDRMFTVDVNAGSAAAIGASVTAIPGIFNDRVENGIVVTDIAFDLVPGGVQLLALMGTDQGDQGGGGGGGGGQGGQGPVIVADTASIAVVNIANTDLSTRIPLFEGAAGNAQALGGLTGLEVLDDDPARVDDAIAVGNGNSYQIFRAGNFFIGGVRLLGPLLEPVNPLIPTPPQPDPTGAAASDLMFVEGLIDPFTSTAGSYIGYDQATNKLFFVNRSEQRGQQIFQIYISSSDMTGRISIAHFRPPVSRLEAIPFAGSVEGVRHINAQDITQFPWPVDTAGSDTGTVWIGARTRDLDQQDPNDDLQPLLTATVPANVNLGLLPEASLPFDTQTGRRIVNAGLTVNGDIGQFMLGGALTGDVHVTGSVGQMYVGWLLTGNALGDLQNPPPEFAFLRSPSRPQNFTVGGDLRALYVLDSVGTHDDTAMDRPTYLTGFDLQVAGTIGDIRVGDSWIGDFQVRNQPDLDASVGVDIPQDEFELKTVDIDPRRDFLQYRNNPFFFNDTFDNPEFRAGFSALGQGDIVQTRGLLQHTDARADWNDYYAVALMAGQSVQVQLLSGSLALNLGVFDPYGRIVASDYSNVGSLAGEMFQFTADRPGAYRFAVSGFGNPDFLNGRNSPLNAEVPYELRISDIGDLAVGGVSVQNNMFDLRIQQSQQTARSYTADFGDIGALYSVAGAILSISPNATVRVSNGNLRALDGLTIGYGTAAVPSTDPNTADTAASLNASITVDVPSGSVGHVRSRTGILAFNPGASFAGRAIGGDFQMIDAATSMGVNLIANGSVGVIRAGDMATIPASVISANFDDTGPVGVIDLIDVRGTLGTLNAGGPQISTGTGGNVRYMRVGGAAFIDTEFGGGEEITTLHATGEEVALKDDGGGTIRLIPTGQNVPNPAFDPNQPSTPLTNPEFLFTTPNALTVRSYPIRGSGGVVLMDVDTDDSVRIEGSSDGATVEIGTIRIAGARAVGAPVVRDPTRTLGDFTSILDFFLPETARAANNGFLGTGFEPLNPGAGGNLGEGDYRRAPNPLLLQPAPPRVLPGAPPATTNRTPPAKQDLSVIIGGTGRVDVWSIVGVDDSGIADDAQFSEIRNDTPGGELVNITAVSVGQIISNGTIGIAQPHVSNTALFAAQYAPESSIPFPVSQYPFNLQTSGVWIYGDLDENHAPLPFILPTVPGTVAPDPLQQALPEPGNIISVRARDGIGNVVANGSIGEVIPDKDNMRNRTGVFAGIQGVIWARGNNPDVGPVAFSDEGGDIYFVDIGEGVRASGSGSFARAGIFGARRIDTVQGHDADIRGDIVAGDNQNPLYIESTTTTINQVTFQTSRRSSLPDSIGRVILRDGSIINADVLVDAGPSHGRAGIGLIDTEFPETLNNPFYEIGQIDVRGNGGIIGSLFSAADVGPISVTKGFGIFSSAVAVAVNGRFQGVQADNYGVRGTTIAAGGSMNYLIARGDGSSRSVASFSTSVRRSEPQFDALGHFNIDPLTGLQPGPLTDLNGYLGTNQLTPEIAGVTDTGILEDIDARGQRNLGRMSAFQLRARNPDIAPSVINFANQVSNVSIKDDINGLQMTTGRLVNFHPNADVFNLDLTVAGQIKDLLIKGDLGGSSVIRTAGPSGNMGTIKILGDVDGDILSSNRIKSLFIGGSMNGTVAALGRKGKAMNSLFIGGGITEGGLNIQGNVGKFVTGSSLGLTGTDVIFQGSVQSITINGDLFSNIKVNGSLGRLTVTRSIITGSTVEAAAIRSLLIGQDLQPGAIIRAGKIGRPRIGGQNLGQIIIA
jgi:hypothetical protein